MNQNLMIRSRCGIHCTRKNAQVLINLKKLYQVFSQVVDKLDGTVTLVIQGCFNNTGHWYSYDVTTFLQSCVVNFVAILLQHVCISELLGQPCDKSDVLVKLVASCS